MNASNPAGHKECVTRGITKLFLHLHPRYKEKGSQMPANGLAGRGLPFILAILATCAGMSVDPDAAVGAEEGKPPRIQFTSIIPGPGEKISERPPQRDGKTVLARGVRYRFIATVLEKGSPIVKICSRLSVPGSPTHSIDMSWRAECCPNVYAPWRFDKEIPSNMKVGVEMWVVDKANNESNHVISGPLATED